MKGILQGCKIIFLMKEITVLQLKQSEGFLSSMIQAASHLDSIYLSTVSASVSPERRDVLQRENYS